MLAHSLDLLMGGKAKANVVRPGADEAWVEGVFDLPPGLLAEPELAELAERLPEGADQVVLGRRVSASGRTSAFVAGRAATAADLKLLGGRLVAFFGQHEHRRLTISSAQLEVLDGFAGREHLELRERYREAHRECLRLGAELAELREREGSRERDLDLYRYELSEIEEVGPDPEERAGIGAERERLRHAEGLREAAAGAHGALVGAEEDGGGAAAALAQAEAQLQGAAGLDPGLDALAERVAALALELGDAGSELRGYAEGLEADPGALLAIEERLEAIDRLERKHGGSVESVLAHAERCREEIARLEGAETRGAEAEAALAEAEARRAELGQRLSAGRAAASAPLEERVAAELERLSMAGASLEVVLEPHPDGFGPTGLETVELRVAPNPGIEAAPLRDAASGGELSRVMLALSGLGEAARRRHRRLRRDRCRDRRHHGAGRGGEAAGARRRAAGDLHHPPAPGRLARRRPLPAGKGRGREAGARPRSSGSTARAWSRRFAACSAATAATRRRPSTPASCWQQPKKALAIA